MALHWNRDPFQSAFFARVRRSFKQKRPNAARQSSPRWNGSSGGVKQSGGELACQSSFRRRGTGGEERAIPFSEGMYATLNSSWPDGQELIKVTN